MSLPSLVLQATLIIFSVISCIIVIVSSLDEESGGFTEALASGPYPSLLGIMAVVSVLCVALLVLKKNYASRHPILRTTAPAKLPVPEDKPARLTVVGRPLVKAFVQDIKPGKFRAAWWLMHKKRASTIAMQLAITAAVTIGLSIMFEATHVLRGAVGEMVRGFAIATPAATLLITWLILSITGTGTSGLVSEASPISPRTIKSLASGAIVMILVVITLFLAGGYGSVGLLVIWTLGIGCIGGVIIACLVRRAKRHIDARLDDITKTFISRKHPRVRHTYMHELREQAAEAGLEIPRAMTYDQFRAYIEGKAKTRTRSKSRVVTVDEMLDELGLDDHLALDKQQLDVHHYLDQLVSMALLEGLLMVTDKPGVFIPCINPSVLLAERLKPALARAKAGVAKSHYFKDDGNITPAPPPPPSPQRQSHKNKEDRVHEEPRGGRGWRERDVQGTIASPLFEGFYHEKEAGIKKTPISYKPGKLNVVLAGFPTRLTNASVSDRMKAGIPVALRCSACQRGPDQIADLAFFTFESSSKLSRAFHARIDALCPSCMEKHGIRAVEDKLSPDPDVVYRFLRDNDELGKRPWTFDELAEAIGALSDDAKRRLNDQLGRLRSDLKVRILTDGTYLFNRSGYLIVYEGQMRPGECQECGVAESNDPSSAWHVARIRFRDDTKQVLEIVKGSQVANEMCTACAKKYGVNIQGYESRTEG